MISNKSGMPTAFEIYKLIFLGSTYFLVPLCCLLGVFALLGFGTITWVDEVLTGFRGLLYSPVMGLLMAIGSTVVNGTMVVIGLWFYAKVHGAEALSRRSAHAATD